MSAYTGEEVERLPNGLEIQPTTLENIRRFAEGGYLYAVIDACDAPAVPEKARELGEEVAVSLFKGSAEEDYWAVAPYLFRVSPETLDWIVATLWKEPWGIFAMSKAGLEELRTHFRRFLIVQLPDGERWYFRYYDPRILRAYLPECNAMELQDLYGPVRAFVPPAGDSCEILRCASCAQHEEADKGQSASTGVLWRIRQAQDDALAAKIDAAMVQHIAQQLKKRFHDQLGRAPSEIVRRAIGDAITAARSLGFEAEGDIEPFVYLSVGCRTTLLETNLVPWIQAVLHKTDVPGEQRMNAVYELLPPALRNCYF